MRASKLRLPDKTAAATMSFSTMAWLYSGARSPELPMQVVQPKAVTPKPRASRLLIRPAASRYSGTTREPGASEVLTRGCTLRPSSTAFLASKPAANKTLGLEVFVHEVIAAIKTSPCPKSMVPSVWQALVGVSKRLSIISISFIFNGRLGVGES